MPILRACSRDRHYLLLQALCAYDHVYTFKISPAPISRTRGKICIGTLGKWRLLFDVRKGKHSASSAPGRRSVEDARCSLKAMNYNKKVHEEDSFFAAEGVMGRAAEPGAGRLSEAGAGPEVKTLAPGQILLKSRDVISRIA